MRVRNLLNEIMRSNSRFRRGRHMTTRWRLKNKARNAIECALEEFIELNGRKNPSFFTKKQSIPLDGRKVIYTPLNTEVVAVGVYDHSELTLGLSNNYYDSHSFVQMFLAKEHKIANLIKCQELQR